MNTYHLHLLDLIAKSSGLLGLAFGVLHSWRGASARQRSMVWLVTFGGLALLPVLMLAPPWWTVTVGTAPAAPSTRPLPLPAPAIPDVSIANAAPAPPSASWSLPSLSVAELLLALWAGGAALLLSRRALGGWQLRMLRRQSVLVRHGPVHALTVRLAREQGLQRPLEVRESTVTTVPVTWGVIRPVLLLPAGAQGWSTARLEAALRHELAHMSHLDAATRLLLSWICALHWPNPLVWLAAKSWRTAQEQACDDVVIRAGSATEDYAMQLLETAHAAQGSGVLRLPVMAMAKPSTLEARLTGIMEDSRNRAPLSRGAGAIGAGLALVLLGLCAAVQPQPAGAQTDKDDVPGKAALLAEKTIHPSLDFTDVPLLTAARLLKEESVKLDPAGKGLRIGFDRTLAQKRFVGVKVTLKGSNVSFKEAVRRVAEQAGMYVVYDEVGAILRGVTPPEAATTSAPREKAPGELLAESIIIPKVSLAGATVDEAVDFCRAKIRELEPAKQGLNIVLGERPKQAAIMSLDLKEVPMFDLLRYISELAGMEVRYSGNTASIAVKSEAPATPTTTTPSTAAPAASTKGAAAQKAAAIIIPKVTFAAASLEECMEFFRARIRLQNTPHKDLKLVIAPLPKEASAARITMSLTDVPLSEALHYVAQLAGVEVGYTADAAVLRAPAVTLTPPATVPTGSPLRQKAGSIIIPSVKFAGATLNECVEFLRIKGRELDPAKQGLNILLDAQGATQSANAQITLELKDVPLLEALRYVAELAGLDLAVEQSAITLKGKVK